MVDGAVTHASGTGEREAASKLSEGLGEGATLGADKAYDVEAFVEELKARKIVPQPPDRRREHSRRCMRLKNAQADSPSRRHHKETGDPLGYRLGSPRSLGLEQRPSTREPSPLDDAASNAHSCACLFSPQRITLTTSAFTVGTE